MGKCDQCGHCQSEEQKSFRRGSKKNSGANKLLTRLSLTLSVLDQVTIEEGGALAHPTRDRAKVPRGRRLPTRGHLLSVVLYFLRSHNLM